MYVVAFVSALAVLLTYLEGKKTLPHGMRWGFIFLTILGCIHYDYGNDYLGYQDIYDNITKYPFNFNLWITGEIWKEPGWAALCYICEPLGGFFMLIALLSILQNVLIYRMIKKWVEKRWWALSVFVYVFTTSYFLLGFSMIRQYLVMCIFLGIWTWIVEKKWIKSLLVLLLCTTIHGSSLILVPFAFWGYVPMNNKKKYAIVIMALFILFWFAGSVLSGFLNYFLSFEQYAGYADSYGDSDSQNTFGLGYLINQIPFILALCYLYKRRLHEMKFSDYSLITISCINFLIYPFSTIIPLILRMSLYFGMFQIIAIPKIYADISNKSKVNFLLLIYVFITLYTYVNFFNSPTWAAKYTTFKTIFPEIF